MIPKNIHICWLSGDEYPKSIKRCLDSWKKYLPDYNIILWDTKRFDVSQLKWTREAFQTKKYAFAADYIRMYALYNYGGIYLDSDVEVYKSFDDLLDLPYFWGEDNVHCFEPAIIGAEKGCGFIYDIMRRYEDRAFIRDGRYDMRGLPLVCHDMLTPKYKFRLMKDKDDFKNDNGVINIFPYDYFNSRDFCGAYRYPNSYCSHNYASSWMKGQRDWKKELKRKMPRAILNSYYGCRYLLVDKKRLAAVQIPYSESEK
jgi:hypothetical protein